MYAVKVKYSAAVAPCSTPRRRCLSNRIAVPGYAPKFRLDTKAVPKWIICGSSPHGAAETVVSSDDKPFLDELRQYAMKLHTREQAPAEGQAEAPKEKKPFVPTKKGYLRFMEESKIVYDTFEEIVATNPMYESLRNNGLERGQPLAEDITYAINTWNLTPVEPSSDSVGSTYAEKLKDLSKSSPPAFICHYYNHYFAHTAGGRMIGKQVSEAALDGWMGKFYKWEGNVKSHLDGVREKLNEMAKGWSEEEKQACLEETPVTFKMSGSLLKLIAEQ